MKIAVMGFRGIPAKYGGFETFIEELAPRLVERGHNVTVYGRSNIIDYEGRTYKGVKLVILPTISHKYLDTVAHTLLSVLDSLFRKHEIVLMLNTANSPFSWIPRLAGRKVVLNVDGIERLRKKWNLIGRGYYRVGEFLATLFPNVIVSDAEVIRNYYRRTYKKESVMIPYGTHIEKVTSRDILDGFGLEPKSYVLYISRLEPENNAHLVIEAFKKVSTEKKLVIVGDAPYAEKYKRELRRAAAGDRRILFTGFVFGLGYKQLQSHAYCYVQATEVGGTHPALIEAMGFGNCIIANGTPENREVLGEAGFLYRKNDIDDLREKLQFVLDHPEVISSCGQRARVKAVQKYSWESVVDKYEHLFLGLLRR